MKSSYKPLTITLGALALAFFFVTNSAAECGGMPKAHPSQSRQARFLPAALVTIGDHDGDDAGIVGSWHVKFVSPGSEGIPDGTEVDAGYSQWHSDGTEIMNSGGRPPIAGGIRGRCRKPLRGFAIDRDDRSAGGGEILRASAWQFVCRDHGCRLWSSRTPDPACLATLCRGALR